MALGMDKLVEQYLRGTGDARRVVPDPEATYFGTPVNDQSLTPGKNPRLGTMRFAQWLEASAKKP